MAEVQAYYHNGTGIVLPKAVYQQLETLLIEQNAERCVRPKFAVEELADLTGYGSEIDVLFVASHEGVVAGTCYAKDSGRAWSLDGAFVSAGKRGKRIFSAVMEEVKAGARAMDIAELHAQPDPKAPEYWESALARWGFEPAEADPNTLICEVPAP